MKNYRRALYEANQDLAHCLVEREKIDHRIARLETVITDLQNLCAELDRKSFENRVDRVIRSGLKQGITETARLILKETFFPMNARELKTGMEARKLDLSRYSNPLAVIHTVLKRLVQSGEVKVVARDKGRKAYQWVRPTEKLLSEVLRTNEQIGQGRDGRKDF